MCACFCVCVNLRVCDTAWQTLPSPLKANVGFHPIDTNRSSDLPCIDMKHKMTNLSAVICLSVSSSEKRLFKKNKKKTHAHLQKRQTQSSETQQSSPVRRTAATENDEWFS